MRPLLLALAVLVPSIQPISAQIDAAQKEALLKKANEAGTVLRDFLQAKTWEEAAQYVLDAEVLKPVMEKHYAEFEWMGKEVLAVRGTGATRIPSKEIYHVVRADLVVKGLEDYVRVSVVEDGDSFKVDWETFAQAYDTPVESFLEKKEDSPRFFRMGLYRGNILSEHEKIPLNGEKIRLIADWKPKTEKRVDLFALKDSDLGKAVAANVPYDDFIACRVKVKWNKAGDVPFIELLGLETIDIRTPSVVSGPLE
tara:strand:- start:14384 stop:15145 length:762 start_codon:yes stop_codon:yes gene_type:complete